MSITIDLTDPSAVIPLNTLPSIEHKDNRLQDIRRDIRNHRLLINNCDCVFRISTLFDTEPELLFDLEDEDEERQPDDPIINFKDLMLWAEELQLATAILKKRENKRIAHLVRKRGPQLQPTEENSEIFMTHVDSLDNNSESNNEVATTSETTATATTATTSCTTTTTTTGTCQTGGALPPRRININIRGRPERPLDRIPYGDNGPLDPEILADQTRLAEGIDTYGRVTASSQCYSQALAAPSPDNPAENFEQARNERNFINSLTVPPRTYTWRPRRRIGGSNFGPYLHRDAPPPYENGLFRHDPSRSLNNANNNNNNNISIEIPPYASNGVAASIQNYVNERERGENNNSSNNNNNNTRVNAHSSFFHRGQNRGFNFRGRRSRMYNPINNQGLNGYNNNRNSSPERNQNPITTPSVANRNRHPLDEVEDPLAYRKALYQHAAVQDLLSRYGAVVVPPQADHYKFGMRRHEWAGRYEPEIRINVPQFHCKHCSSQHLVPAAAPTNIGYIKSVAILAKAASEHIIEVAKQLPDILQIFASLVILILLTKILF